MIIEILSIVLMSLGCVVMFSASIGLIRFRDTYMRLHACAKASTGGALTILLGVLLYTGLVEFAGKIVIVIVLIIITSPILSHALARAAYLKGGGEEISFIDYEDRLSKGEEEIMAAEGEG